MKQLNQCHICRQEIAKYICKKCGQYAGEHCYSKENRLCIFCAQGKTI